MKNISSFNAQSICIPGLVQLATVLLKLNCLTFISYDQQFTIPTNQTSCLKVLHKIDNDDKCKWKSRFWFRTPYTCGGAKRARFVGIFWWYTNIYLYSISTARMISRQVVEWFVHLWPSNHMYTRRWLLNRTPAFSMCLVLNTSRFGRLIVEWSVENMTSDVTLYGMSLDASA